MTRDQSTQFPPLRDLPRYSDRAFIDPRLIDRPIGEPVNPWPRLLAAMRDRRGLVVVGVIFALAVLI